MTESNTIRVKGYEGRWLDLQPTGRADSTRFEVFYDDGTMWLSKEIVYPDHKYKIPREDPELAKREGELLFIPEAYVAFCEDKHLRWLTSRVWRRLSLDERRLIAKVSPVIVDHENKLSRYNYIFVSTLLEESSAGALGSCPAQVAENLKHYIYLSEAKEVESDSAAMFVIAREFAKISLRYNELFAVAGSMINSEPESYYTRYLTEQADWAELHATLIAWLWGFKEEREAYQAERPQRCNKSWYADKNSRD